jgi:hypothetical protein
MTGAVLVVLTAVACSGAVSNQPPQAPEAVSAYPIPGGVRVAWVDTSGNEEEFIVFRATVGGDDEEAALTEIARVPTDGTTYEDLDVDMAGDYTYAVAASNRFGTSDQVFQDPAEPVSPGVGVRLTLTFDGVGAVDVLNGGQTVTCTSQCVMGLAQGSSVTLTASGAAGLAFAGWAGACSMAGSCTFIMAHDTDVEARFRKHVLLLLASGDSPVDVVVSPVDDFAATECSLAAGQTCAFGYAFDAALKVSINSTLVEPQAVFGGYGGACTAPQGRYCLLDVDGETAVEIAALRVPVAEPKAYEGREDATVSVSAGDGLLAGVIDSPGDSHEAFVTAGPTAGTLNVAADGSFEYQPAQDANGDVTFDFAVRDALGNVSAPRTTTLNLVAVNDPPRFVLANDPPGTLGAGQFVSIPGFATGLHPGGGVDEAGQSLTFSITPPAGPPGQAVASNVSLTIDPGGTTATLSYTARNGALGSSTYQVSLKDDGGTANQGNDTSSLLSFTITAVPVRLTLSTTAGGTLDPAVGVHDYAFGTSVDVTASPASGYRFAGWSGACSNLVNPCQVSMTADRSLNGTFWPLVTVVPSGGFFFVSSTPAGISGCSILSGPDACRSTFSPGSQVTLTVNDIARTFTGVTCDGGNVTTSCTFTVTGPVTVGVS